MAGSDMGQENTERKLIIDAQGTVRKVKAGEDGGTDITENLDEKIFGSAGGFGEKFRGDHKLPKIVPANPASGIMRDFDPVQAFNAVAASGLGDQPSWYRASSAIETSRSEGFRLAAKNGLLKLLVTNIYMKASRIDALANDKGLGILQSEMGPTPQGISQWLTIDNDTKLALGYLFKLAGYQVNGVDDMAKPAEVVSDFSDFAKLTEGEIDAYLKTITTKVNCESGITRVAFTIFRIMGFPHGNAKMTELRAKYQRECPEFDTDGKRLRPNNEPAIPVTDDSDEKLDEKGKLVVPARTLGRKALAPLIDKLKVNERPLKDYLEQGGMDEFIKALAEVPANEIMRKWSDFQLLLDIMDAVQDVRVGEGKAGAVEIKDKLKIIQDAMGTANAKRILSVEDRDNLLDPEKLESKGGQLELPRKKMRILERKILKKADASLVEFLSFGLIKTSRK